MDFTHEIFGHVTRRAFAPSNFRHATSFPIPSLGHWNHNKARESLLEGSEGIFSSFGLSCFPWVVCGLHVSSSAGVNFFCVSESRAASMVHTSSILLSTHCPMVSSSSREGKSHSFGGFSQWDWKREKKSPKCQRQSVSQIIGFYVNTTNCQRHWLSSVSTSALSDCVRCVPKRTKMRYYLVV
jgi:hypothetical protein